MNRILNAVRQNLSTFVSAAIIIVIFLSPFFQVKNGITNTKTTCGQVLSVDSIPLNSPNLPKQMWMVGVRLTDGSASGTSVVGIRMTPEPVNRGWILRLTTKTVSGETVISKIESMKNKRCH